MMKENKKQSNTCNFECKNEVKQKVKSRVQSHKGITLMTLVITIIVMLILVGVAVTSALDSDGIFSKANKTADEWNARVAEDDEKTNEIWAKILGKSDEVKEVKQVSDINPGTLEGTGTAQNPYTINSIEDLVAFAYDVNNNNNTYNGKIVALGCDLDFQNDKSYVNPQKQYAFNGKGYFEVPSNGETIKGSLTGNNSAYVGWAPIGKGDNDGFCGIFDGQDYYIKNLYMRPYSYGGLFGKTNKAITIKNLGIVNCHISSNNETGGIVGYAGEVLNIYNCYCSGTIERLNSNTGTGGIIGFAQKNVTINDCYNLCNISSQGKDLGGIIGQIYGTLNVTNAFNSGNIISINENDNTKAGWCGGIAGYAYEINAANCYNVGNIESNHLDVGGIIGSCDSNDSPSSYTNCYNSGNLKGKYGNVGGIAGYSRENALFTNCHNTGNIESDPTSTASSRNYLGEIHGAYESSWGTFNNCTYLTKTTNANPNGATGKSQSEMNATMSMQNFVTLMNQYVSTNNSNPENEKLKTWKLKNGHPVFSDQ